ncbi:MAG: hypothetical protein KBD31_00140 [Proteobacteria bacterium]|nr:hypothetical protein [Pseudomonadota bacterium]
MITAFQKIGYFMWRHMLVILMLCICASVLLTYQTLSLFNSSVLLLAFAAFDFAKTKWIKVDVIQKEHLKKFASFIWRHLLTFVGFFFATYVLAEGHISWVNTISFFIGAIAVDWLKTRKRSYESYDTSDPLTEYSRRLRNDNYWNSSIVSTPAYLSALSSTSANNRY